MGWRVMDEPSICEKCGLNWHFGRYGILNHYRGSCPCGASIHWDSVGVRYWGDWIDPNGALVHFFEREFPVHCRFCRRYINDINVYCFSPVLSEILYQMETNPDYTV